jgi:hypothetical protein
VARSLKKTEEKPLNVGAYCHLLIFPMSLRSETRTGSLDTIAADVATAKQNDSLTALEEQLANVCRVGPVSRMRYFRRSLG